MPNPDIFYNGPSGLLEISDGPDEQVFYSNVATALSTPEELILHFGIRTDNPRQATGVAKIILSLPHAKRLVATLASIIEGYETTFGNIETDVDKRLTQQGREMLEQRLSKSSDGGETNES